MERGGSGIWVALGGPVPSYVSIALDNKWEEGSIRTTWVVEAQITPTNSNWNAGEYRISKRFEEYPTKQDVYEVFMFFRNQGPWCAANAFYDSLKSLFHAGVGHDAVRDFVNEETITSVMTD